MVAGERKLVEIRFEPTNEQKKSIGKEMDDVLRAIIDGSKHPRRRRSKDSKITGLLKELSEAKIQLPHTGCQGQPDPQVWESRVGPGPYYPPPLGGHRPIK